MQECKINAVFSLSDLSENAEMCVTGSRIPKQMTDDSISNDSIKVFTENLLRTSVFRLILYSVAYGNIHKIHYKQHDHI